MKLDSAILGTEVETIGVSNTQEGGMKASSLAKFIDLITVQAYSNPEGSIVRELTSNCFDAHIKWQKRERERFGESTFEYNQPVILKYSEEEGQGFISFIDRGTGLSPTDMKEIYIDIGTSDKDTDDDFLGCYGVGSKSFLSYTPSIDLITRVDGIEYHYLVYKNARGLLEYDCTIQKDTIEHNGTEVKLCIGTKEYIRLGYSTEKDSNGYGYRTKDFLRFREEILKQLYYFDNVYTVGFDLENNYQIYEADNFKIRNGFNPFKEMHLILGKVAYPIDWTAVGIEKLNIPVGIKFNIGELYVTLSRESIRYNDEERNNLIKERINLTIDEIRRRYNKSSSEVDTLEEYLRHLESPDKILVIEDVEIKLPKKQTLNKKEDGYENIDVIEGLREVKWKPLVHLPIQIPKDPYFIFNIKGILMSPDKKGNHQLTNADNTNSFKTVVTYKDSVYRIKGERSKVTDNYLWWNHSSSKKPLYIAKDRASFGNYCKILGLTDKLVTRQVSNADLLGKKKVGTPINLIENGQNVFYGKTFLIKEYKKAITKDLLSRSESYEKQEPTAAYLSELQLQKIARKRPKLVGKIVIYDLVNGNSSTGSELDLSTLEKYKGFIIYGEREKLVQLQGVKEMLSNIAPVQTPIRWRIVPGKMCLRDSKHHYKPVPTRNFKNESYGGKEVGRTIRRGYLSWLRDNVGRIFITAKSNHKQLQGNPYFMHIDEFMSNNNRMFRNSVTAWHIKRKLDRLERTNSHLVIHLEAINSNLYSKYKELEKWANSNWRQYYSNEAFMEICYKTALEKNMLWDDKLLELRNIEKWFTPDLRIFEKIDKSAYLDENLFKDIILLLKTKHKRLSVEHYTSNIKPEKPEVVYTILPEPIEHQLLIYNNKQTA